MQKQRVFLSMLASIFLASCGSMFGSQSEVGMASGGASALVLEKDALSGAPGNIASDSMAFCSQYPSRC
ncbi:L-serine deaminase [Sagittula marina]|uniref:L-serine deaminase n=1 Tax=Sagittula marina TaxID=943940 RepID=A0A7W6GS81_9RHOB|nr:L-serine deaminase [Sagittula marina]